MPKIELDLTDEQLVAIVQDWFDSFFTEDDADDEEKEKCEESDCPDCEDYCKPNLIKALNELKEENESLKISNEWYKNQYSHSLNVFGDLYRKMECKTALHG